MSVLYNIAPTAATPPRAFLRPAEGICAILCGMKKQLILSFAFGLGLTFNAEKNIRHSDAAPRCVLQAEADDLYEQMGTIRPAVSRVTIKSSK